MLFLQILVFALFEIGVLFRVCSVCHPFSMEAEKSDYNSRLKHIGHKGLCGDPEVVDDSDMFQRKMSVFAKLVQESNHTVLFTGAGISTCCGIPDFRGPNGVWTQEQRGEAPNSAVNHVKHNVFSNAQPSFTHNAIACLTHAGIFKHNISQNVDCLHLRSGVPEAQLSELHGNIFKEKCEKCKREHLRDFDVGGMGLQYTGRECEVPNCSGKLKDMAIDWDTPLPEKIFHQAHCELDTADLVISLGTSLRVQPAGNMPLRVLKPKKRRDGRVGKLVIVNLQQTHLDKQATLKINGYCDEVMKLLCDEIGIEIKPAEKRANGEVSCDIASRYTVKEGSIAEQMIRRTRVGSVNIASAATAAVPQNKPTKRKNVSSKCEPKRSTAVSANVAGGAVKRSRGNLVNLGTDGGYW